MPVRRRDTAADSAARFLATYRGPRREEPSPRPPRREEPAPDPRDLRFVLNVAAATLEELKACVDEKLAAWEAAGEDPPHITVIARQMLDEAVPRIR